MNDVDMNDVMEAEVVSVVPVGLPARITREELAEVEARMKHEALKPDSGFHVGDYFPLTHRFADGLYVREIRVPAGNYVVTKLFKQEHATFLLQGECIVLTETGRSIKTAPDSWITPSGTKRLIYVVKDCIWTTCHLNLTDTRNLDDLEESIIAKSYEEYDEYIKSIDTNNKFVIYKIQNKVNSKVYIGCSSSLKNRWIGHRTMLNNNKHYNKKLQSAWNKYGEENFEFAVLERLKSEEDLIRREQSWIDLVGPEYNICQIAGRTSGVPHTQEFKDTLSKRMIGNKLAAKGHPQTQETRIKISSALKGTRHSPESYERQSQTMKAINQRKRQQKELV